MPRRLQKENIRKRFHPLKKSQRRRRRFVRIFLVILVLLAGLAAVAAIRLNQLEKIIESKFTVAQRWNIPSRVYADSEYLYPGIDVNRRSLVAKLERLGYRQVSQAVKGPGDFTAAPGRIDIFLHDFAYPLEKFTGYPVRLELAQGGIQRMVDLESNEELPLVRLEPEEIATLFDEKMEDRTLVTLKEVPPYLLEAIITVEDERFFRHRGIDPIAIARAALADILALKLAQGGSTLTQQLVKNFFLTSKKSIRRKIDEALMALILERKHTKGEILEAYLNEIYLGQRGPSSVTGVAEASKHYFAKDIHQLTLSESALLAGMIRSPAEYSPLRNREKAKDRRNLVLKKMREANVISDRVYQEALVEEIVTPKTKIRPVVAPYFIDFLKHQIADLYPQDVLQREGLKIFTTLDMSMQLAAEEALVQGLNDLEKKGAGARPKNPEEGLQGCILVVSPQNGYIRAMEGGKNYSVSQFNRCTQAMRQPGSIFKPFVYLTALDPDRSMKPFTNASLISDAAFTVKTVQGPWSPENYDRKEHGDVTLRTALEQSYNIATARLAMEVGLENVVKTARDAGITSPLEPVPSLALGSFEVTPLEMAMAYTVFPNLGVRSEPLSVMNIMTPQGEALERKTLRVARVFDAAPVALADSLMKGVFERGTAAGARGLGFTGIAAGKTGTSSNYRDAWFVGFTPQVLSLVWTGFDDNTSLNMSGARAALPIWAAFMKKAVGISTQDFTFPKEIVQVKIDPLRGGYWTKSCPKSFPEHFIKGTEPDHSCRDDY